jgi:hypothetical protein
MREEGRGVFVAHLYISFLTHELVRDRLTGVPVRPCEVLREGHSGASARGPAAAVGSSGELTLQLSFILFIIESNKHTSVNLGQVPWARIQEQQD